MSENSKTSRFFIVLTLCAGLGGILYGYDIGVISGALTFVNQAIPMTRLELSVIVGAVLGGGLIGTIITGSLADRFGRRTMIIVACIIFTGGIITIELSHSFVTLLLARILLGIGVGVVAVAVPLYLSETAPAKFRGRSVSAFQVFLTIGVLLAYVVDYFFTASGNWHAMFLVILIPNTFLLVSMILLPETPRFLIEKSRDFLATKVLQRIRGHEDVSDELNNIRHSLTTVKGHWSVLFSKAFVAPLCIAMFIAICNQLTGINVILQFAPTLMKDAGMGSNAISMMGSIGVGVVQVVFTLLAISLIDVVGRCRLLVIGTAGVMLANIYLGFCSHYMVVGPRQAEASLIGLMVYILFYAIGPGVVVWLAISELLPTKVRGKSVALCLFVNSLTASLLASVFLPFIHMFGMSAAYFGFAFFTFLYFLTAKYLLPETRGRTLEEIQAGFQNKNLPEVQMQH